ncbi:hypothetical protein AB0C34_03190 [Nocardia sp. NPDC049220]|uniref:hypothetical protein n=1 Tax=Nocardia sp. NPDC049220 TaxID=3155273 RepID=UPI0034107A1A
MPALRDAVRDLGVAGGVRVRVMLEALRGEREQVDAFVERAGKHLTALAQDDAVRDVDTAVNLRPSGLLRPVRTGRQQA